MSLLTTNLDIAHVRKIEKELFDLIDLQVHDKINGVKFNYERDKRIDDLKGVYARYLVYQK